jgi:hypothetical protein
MFIIQPLASNFCITGGVNIIKLDIFTRSSRIDIDDHNNLQPSSASSSNTYFILLPKLGHEFNGASTYHKTCMSGMSKSSKRGHNSCTTTNRENRAIYNKL